MNNRDKYVELKKQRKVFLVGEGIMAAICLFAGNFAVFLLFLIAIVVTYYLYTKKMDEEKYMQDYEDDENLDKLHRLENEIYDMQHPEEKEKDAKE